jgi:hypothetical protein
MRRRKKDPLRALSAEERAELERLGRAGRESAAVVAHAKAVLAVANSATYSAAARAALGRCRCPPGRPLQPRRAGGALSAARRGTRCPLQERRAGAHLGRSPAHA